MALGMLSGKPKISVITAGGTSISFAGMLGERKAAEKFVIALRNQIVDD